MKTSKMVQEISTAWREFSPIQMMKHLHRTSDGAVVFDRESVANTPERVLHFHSTMNPMYTNRFSDLENLTIYFEMSEGVLMGGAYDYSIGKRLSARRIASTGEYTPYTYTEEVLKSFEIAIDNA